MLQSRATTRVLMCPPEHFEVTYAINPWMDPNDWARDDHALVSQSRREWAGLCRAIRTAGAEIETMPAVRGLPDLVFTANAAVVLDRKVLLSRFRFAERQGEEPHAAAAFRALQTGGVVDSVSELPDDIVLEGAGDCVWDRRRELFWMGYGPRSDAAARSIVAAEFDADVQALELADARFYHMDTALCPLSGGEVMYVPQAFTAEGLTAIRDRVAPEQRIEIAADDAGRLAANAVCIDTTVISAGMSDQLRGSLEERGYRVMIAPLSSFLRSGGGAFCLTLRLDHRSAGPARQERAA
jgi:N-dimethylarginine dimethylaminohydrolase